MCASRAQQKYSTYSFGNANKTKQLFSTILVFSAPHLLCAPLSLFSRFNTPRKNSKPNSSDARARLKGGVYYFNCIILIFFTRVKKSACPIDTYVYRRLTERSRACSRVACLSGSTTVDREEVGHRRNTLGIWSATSVHPRTGRFARVRVHRIRRTPLHSVTFPGRRSGRCCPRDRRD